MVGPLLGIVRAAEMCRTAIDNETTSDNWSELMTISIVTDELGLELEPAIEAIKSWGLDHVELRGVVGGRYPDGFLEGTAKLVSENGLTVTALSPGVFKCLPEKDIIAKHLERLQIAVSGAPMFGADQVIVFSVESPDGDPPQQMVVDAFKRQCIAGWVGNNYGGKANGFTV